ncbi:MULTISPECIES: YuiA family protein [Geobacillus]|nr:YuiA family protein [Geobacillus sp. 46C-IIa]QNU28398.1 YuiA family protein [Geobacillus sp. 46C-IIa]
MKQTLTVNACPYCEGHGYVQLLLGGSETCYSCQGTGGEQEESDEH